MDSNILLVGIGGIVGCVARYLVTEKIISNFPFGTLTVNIVGCFLIGVIYGLADQGAMTAERRILLATGFCGGFTTFSAFSIETVRLMQNGEFALAALNAVGSVVIGMFATYLGLMLVRYVGS